MRSILCCLVDTGLFANFSLVRVGQLPVRVFPGHTLHFSLSPSLWSFLQVLSSFFLLYRLIGPFHYFSRADFALKHSVFRRRFDFHVGLFWHWFFYSVQRQ
jgi:hypothetical protein